MKKSTMMMGASFLLAIAAAVASIPATAAKPMTARWQVVNGVCKTLETTQCNGPSTNVICANVYAARSLAGACNGITYFTVNP